MRLSQVGSPDILGKFDATFEGYWQSAEYEDYDPARDGDRLANALAPTADSNANAPLMFLDVTPWPHQTEILEKLAAERERHHRFKNLVVAATGTGKTIVAALDFKRLRAQMGELRALRVPWRDGSGPGRRLSLWMLVRPQARCRASRGGSWTSGGRARQEPGAVAAH